MIEKNFIPPKKKSLSALSAREITVFDMIPSTNTALLEHLKSGDGEKRIYAAVSQSAGRGRLGRSFISDVGGIYFSFNAALPCERAEYIGCVTPAAGVSVVSALKKLYGIEPEIKWVNDIILGEKKLSGILSESVIKDGKIHIVIGIGLNVTKSPLPEISTCLFDRGITECDANILISEIISEFEKLFSSLENVYEKYLPLLSHIGKAVRVHTFDGDCDYDAVCVGITPTCELIVKLEDGHEKVLLSGEVSVRL